MRYAIYYAPAADDPLAERAARWLGRDAATGADLPQPEIAGVVAPTFAALTASPRGYGFHGTLKAPIRLADGCTETDFLAAVAYWATTENAFTLPRLEVGSLGQFLALRPAEPSPALAAMAERCVRQLDRFRAPPTPEEITRRRPETLPPREREYLEAWGYPYVLERYRFHLTLTDSIADAGLRARLHDAASAWFANCLGARTVAEVCVFVQEAADRPFLLKYRFPFSF